MGICLDTEANTAAQEADGPGDDWKGGGGQRSAMLRTPESAIFPMQNGGKVKFDPPKVPVIFILGGPGSGKVTHCDTLMQEKRGVTHINMMDLLQQYALGNDMQDFAQLPSKTVTEVLMLEMKMAPAAKTYLVSGYPRNMRDVVNYSEKIQVVNGVILISWRQAVLQKQIDYGAKLGHVVLSLAKMELENFFKNVMPVADYFDQSDMLTAVNGERAPSEVYKDFRASVLEILGAQENQEALLNGVAGMGRGVDDIPGSIVSVDTAPSQVVQTRVRTAQRSADLRDQHAATVPHPNAVMGQNVGVTRVPNNIANFTNIPPIILIIGGPGSNKASLCMKAVAINTGWSHFSMGRLLRTVADVHPKPQTEEFAVKEAISAGEMVAKKFVDTMLETQILQYSDKKGILIDGYPRDIKQVMDFEERFKRRPPIVLLDCSKLQLGRGRLDDTVSSFRRRLELFREHTLPMLKQLDTDGRLTIVDGDTDSPSVQRTFERIIRQHIQELIKQHTQSTAMRQQSNSTSPQLVRAGVGVHQSVYHVMPNTRTTANHDTVVHDLEDVADSMVPTISHHVSLANGHLGRGLKPVESELNAIKNNANKNVQLLNGRASFRKMLDDADNFPIDSHL